MMRRVGSGTLAGFLGKDLLEIDQFFHTHGIPKPLKESSAAFLSQGKTSWKKAAESYIAGVNEFIEYGTLPRPYTSVTGLLVDSDALPPQHYSISSI